MFSPAHIRVHKFKYHPDISDTIKRERIYPEISEAIKRETYREICETIKREGLSRHSRHHKKGENILICIGDENLRNPYIKEYIQRY